MVDYPGWSRGFTRRTMGLGAIDADNRIIALYKRLGARDMELELDTHNMRVVKARLGARLAGFWLLFIKLSIWMLIVIGICLILINWPLGWLVMSLAALPFMLERWYEGELKRVPVIKGGDKIGDRLSGDILGRLSDNPTPKMIASAAESVVGGQFFAARFGLTANLMSNITSDNQNDSQAVWQAAVKLADKLDRDEITPGILIYSLVKNYPDHEMLLAQLHIDLADIENGVRWQNNIFDISKSYSIPRRTGGIARDFSFGYTPKLRHFGQNISEQISHGGLLTTGLDVHDEIIDKLIQTFGGSGQQNAVLVGQTGVGKRTIIQSFAERLLDATSKLPDSLKFRQVFILDAAALVSAAPGRGQLENLVMEILSEAYGAKNIIICLDNAQLFFEEGIGSVDLTNVLLPILEAGNLRMVLTMDEQRLLQISQRNSALVNALNRIIVKPTNKQDTMRVMQDSLIITEFQKKVTYSYQALGEAYTLSERYVHDIAMPGRAIKLLVSAASYSQGGLVTMNSVRDAIEQTMDIKVGVATGEQEKETLLNLEQLIHRRMINQTRAVGVVSDALRRARAGVRNQDRPIGTFLFLGPTGVGKTELAKALADVYFGGEDRIVRLDLNEFVRNEDVSRLIADGADDPSSLTAQVMKQPFSVVLLDEIEKAHPNVLTTLLQLLDEGILRDIKNREVSFRDAIVIATSNAGADRIREYIERGYKLEAFEEKFVDELIDSGQFKPEFLNRFDEMVTFTPLGRSELLQVVDLMLEGVNKTLASQKITVVVDDTAKLLLVEKGYDPRLGARPMRRVIQRVVENNVAKAILSGSIQSGATITITASQVEDTMGKAERAQAIQDDSM